jgi:hypothetical protein
MEVTRRQRSTMKSTGKERNEKSVGNSKLRRRTQERKRRQKYKNTVKGPFA